MLDSYVKEVVSACEQVPNFSNVFVCTTSNGHRYVRKETLKPEREHRMLRKAAKVGINTPNSLVYKGALCMEYITPAKYFSPQLAKTTGDYVTELARILAFNVITGNLDNFTFISYFLDNIYYSSSPNYHPVNIFASPMINEGNILISEGKIWLIDLDDYAYNNPSWNKFLTNLPRSVLYELCAVFSNYMNFSLSEGTQFRKEFLAYYDNFLGSL